MVGSVLGEDSDADSVALSSVKEPHESVGVSCLQSEQPRALLQLVGWGSSRQMFAQTPSSNPVYGVSSTIGSLATGNMITLAASQTDWNAYRNTLITIANDWQMNNYDSQLQSHYAVLTPSLCKSVNLDQPGILRRIQITHSGVTLAQLQHGWAVYDGLSDASVASVLASLRLNGMLPSFTSAMQQAARYAQFAPTPTVAVVRGMTPQWLIIPPPGTGKGAGYCDNASFAVDALGIAFLTIGIMSGIGVIAEGAAWAMIAAWGGGATTVYATANRWLC